MARFSLFPRSAPSRRAAGDSHARARPRAGRTSRPRSSGSAALERRRLFHLLRRMGAALAAAALAWSLASTIVMAHGTRQVVVASGRIPRGKVIGESDLDVRTVAAESALDAAFGDMREAIGMTALVDMESGQPVMRAMARSTPLPGAGETVVDVPLASSGSQFVAGDVVRLMSSSCPQGATGTQGEPDTDGGQSADGAQDAPDAQGAAHGDGAAGTGNGMCVVVPRATVIAAPATDDGPSPLAFSGVLGDEAAMTRLAMDPASALAALALRETAPIVAVPAVVAVPAD